MSSTLRIENGDRIWRDETGAAHRNDGPAAEWANGYKAWYNRGKRHRENGPAVEHANAHYKEWWVHGKPHRIDGPAIERTNRYNAWYIYGELHRVDGPAMEWVNGDKQWWIRGKEYTQMEFTNLIVQHHLKLQLLSRVIPTGAESLVYHYTL